jgi:hypothetical protein
MFFTFFFFYKAVLINKMAIRPSATFTYQTQTHLIMFEDVSVYNLTTLFGVEPSHLKSTTNQLVFFFGVQTGQCPNLLPNDTYELLVRGRSNQPGTHLYTRYGVRLSTDRSDPNGGYYFEHYPASSIHKITVKPPEHVPGATLVYAWESYWSVAVSEKFDNFAVTVTGGQEFSITASGKALGAVAVHINLVWQV